MRKSEILYEVIEKETEEKCRERQGQMMKAYHQKLKSVQKSQKHNKEEAYG